MTFESFPNSARPHPKYFFSKERWEFAYAETEEVANIGWKRLQEVAEKAKAEYTAAEDWKDFQKNQYSII